MVDRQDKVLVGFIAVAGAVEVCAAGIAAQLGGGSAASMFDDLFAHRATLSALNLVGCLAIMLWPAWKRPTRGLLDALYFDEASFESAFKAFWGGFFGSAVMAACLGTAALSGRAALPRTVTLQVVTALAAPAVLAFFVVRTIALGSIVLRIYRAL